LDHIRCVIAATDFSTDASHACLRATLLAAEHSAALDLLHVVEPDQPMALRDWLAVNRDLRSQVEQQLDMQLTAQAQQLTASHGVPVRKQLRFGPVIEEVAAASADANLLVVGARGAHVLRRLTLGTTAERLIRRTVPPVLMVRRPAEGPYRRVLVLTDFSQPAQAAFELACALAPGAAIHLMHAFELPFQGRMQLGGLRKEEIDAYRRQALASATRRLQDSPGATQERVHANVLFGDVRAEALRTIDELGADLVAVGKQGDSMLADMFLGSTTNCMIAHASCDVLVVPRNRAGT
jgi:nucleotide-binding universal stress UspA family protein